MKVVFLDRDGVINRFPGKGSYVTKIREFHFLPGSLNAIRQLTEAGFEICVISNQAGVGRGIFTQTKLDQIDTYMHRHVQKAGGKIYRSFYCTHHPDEGCSCRKPGIGLIVKALASLKKPLSEAKDRFLVGDMQLDMQTGHTAGCRTIFVTSGGEPKPKFSTWPIKPDFIRPNLQSAVELIIA